MDTTELLKTIRDAYGEITYPAGFQDQYVIMECLAERNGIDTFLVQRLEQTPSDHAPEASGGALAEPADAPTPDSGTPTESADAPAPDSGTPTESADAFAQNGGALTEPVDAPPQDDGTHAEIDGAPVDSDDAPTCYIAKCYDRSVWSIDAPAEILRGLEHDGLPKLVESFEDDALTVTVREYVEGQSLDEYALEHDLTEQQVVNFCVQLCDILHYLHHRPDPIIHRDIKPQNVIVRPDGGLSLIDFDIARTWQADSETDTRFFGTVAYAPPEQYGFTQTDVRSDIYSLGILLRYLLTGNTRENRMVRVYKPLQKIIDKCTAFAPEQRYADVDQVKKALLQATPAAQKKRAALITLCSVAAAAVLFFAGYGIYEKVTYDPFNDEAIPAYVSDEDRITDAVDYLRGKFDTDLFDDHNKIANFGWLRQVLIECYGLDHDYVYRYNGDMPQESDAFFLPWSYPDEQLIGRDEMVYVAVKLYDPEIVADWSSLKDDNGEYPGTRVALAFADKTGLTTGVNKPGDLDRGEVALILANTDRVFTAAEEELQETE